MAGEPAGLGRKHPQLDIPVSKLFLDPENPRLPEDVQGKKEAELLSVLYREFSLDELADSMAQNGYFDEEPLVAIPQKLPRNLEQVDISSREFRDFIREDTTLFTVVEGNRRLATVKLLVDGALRNRLNIKHWPGITELVRKDLSVLPVIIYRKRNDVVPYLGVRHIVGIQKWDSYAKARYIANMIEGRLSVDQIEAQTGDKTGALIKNYIGYKLLNQASDEFDFDIRRAKNDFSLLILAIGQGNIKRFLGLPTKLKDANPQTPVVADSVENMKILFVWMFGTEKIKPVIRESRDITNFLSHIVASKEAVEYLQAKGDIAGAYDRTDGEEKMVIKYLNAATQKLENVLSVVHRHNTPEVQAQVKTYEDVVKAIQKTLEADMIEIPNPESIEEVADWVELMLATEGNQLSKADVSSAIERTTGVEASEVFISSVWRELEYRSDFYSFEFFILHDRNVEPQPGAQARSDYLLCLILSLFGVQGNPHLPGSLFERISREVVENYLDGEAVVFGWPFEKLEGDEEAAIKQKVKQLADNLREEFYETPASRFKDRGLDIVGWKPHNDQRSSQVVLLLQCAAGHNWSDKLPVPLDAWCQYIHWASNPIKAFAVPCVISERDWHDISKDKGVLFDRIRIMNLLADGIEDVELRNTVDEWIQNQIENHAE